MSLAIRTGAYLQTTGGCRAALRPPAHAMPRPAYLLQPAGSRAFQIVGTQPEGNLRLPRTCSGRSVEDRRGRKRGPPHSDRATPLVQATVASERVTWDPHSRRDRTLRTQVVVGNPLVPGTSLGPAPTNSPEGCAPKLGASTSSSQDRST